MKKRIFTILRLIIFVGIGIFLIWIFLIQLDDQQKKKIIESFAGANYAWLLLSLIVAFLSHLVRTLRWQMLLKPMGMNPRFRNTFLALMIGYFANLAVPRLGEVSRCGILTRYEKIPFTNSFGTVISERALDLLTFFLLFFINLAIQYDKLNVYISEKFTQPLSDKFAFFGKGYFFWGFLIAISISILVLVIYRKKLSRYRIFSKIFELARGFWEGLKSLGKVKQPFLFTVYTVLIWVCYYFMTYLCFFSLNETASFGPEPAFSVLVLGTIGIMLLPGGIGIYPVIVAETLVLYGAASATAFALGWLIWGTQTVAIILAGIIALIILPMINVKSNGQTPAHTE